MSSPSILPSSTGRPALRLVGDDRPVATTASRTGGDLADVDLLGDRRRADPVHHTTLRPVERTRRSPGAALLAWGGAIAVVSSGFAVVLGVLVGRIDGARADLALGGAMGDDRSQALVTAAQLSSLGVVLGLVLVIAGGIVRMAPRLR